MRYARTLGATPMSDDWIRADWPAPAGVLAGTTTRRNEAFAFPAEPQWLKQVHGARVVHAGSADFAGDSPEADAIVADRAQEICVVQTADCLPVLLCSIDGQEIAAIHGGWRGLAAGVIEATINALRTDPADLIAWFGPAISQPAFEVGDEVRAAFSDTDPGAAAAFEPNARGRWQADLYAIGRRQLAQQGVTAVYGGGLCTYADKERFFSYRRDGQTGRLYSFIFRGD